MDQQNNPRPAPTPEEIARLEAEAVAALRRDEEPKRPEPPAEAPSTSEASGQAAVEAGPQSDFVPYVDDAVSEPKADGDTSTEDDGEYIPSPWEERVNALTDRQWFWVQIVGGALLGLVALGILYVGSDELATYRMVLAALLALLLPRYIERVIRRDLVIARRAMIAALFIGLLITFLVIGAQHGFNFTKAQ